MTISIVTVSYNAADTIEQTIKSVLCQKANYDIEYIIVDGGSTDGTCDIIREYEHHLSGWSSRPDGGIYDAMNKGIKRTSGHWIGIINSDDWYAEQAFSTFAQLAESNPGAGVIVGGVVRVDEKIMSGKHVKPPRGAFSTLRPNNHPATFVSREVYEQLGMFDLKYQISSDIEFILRIQDIEWSEIVRTNEILAYMREGGASSGFKGILEAYTIERRYGDRKDAFRIFNRKILQKLRRWLLQCVVPASVMSKMRGMWWRTRHDYMRLNEGDYWTSHCELGS